MENTLHPLHLHLLVARGNAVFFSTLLQSGMEMVKCSGETVDSLLSKLPGFTPRYITERVQTIFINGIANDDLKTPLCKASTMAISTAMPGLAGAIFKRNSPHATLRTVSGLTEPRPDNKRARDTIILRIYGAINKEKGPGILAQGAVISSSRLHDFFAYRPSLLSRILSYRINGKEIISDELWKQTQYSTKLTLFVTSKI